MVAIQEIIIKSDIVAGLNWVAANAELPASAVISSSFSGSYLIDSAAENILDEGVTLVTSAGNNNVNGCNYSPNRVHGVITVGSSDQYDYRSNTSNYGSCLELFAPGENVIVPNYTTDSDLVLTSGTSFSAPFVAGVAAIIQSNSSSGTPPNKVRERLIEMASPGRVKSSGSNTTSRLLYSIYFLVHITGEEDILYSDAYTWTAHETGGDTYVYDWQYRDETGYGWVTVGTNKSYSRYVNTSDPNFELRVIVTSQGYQTEDIISINVGGSGDECDDVDPSCGGEEGEY